MNDRCRSLRERLELYLDGALAAGEADPLGDHLLECAACRDWMEADDRLVRTLADPASGGRLSETAASGSSVARWRAVAGVATAAAVVALAWGLWAAKTRPATEPGASPAEIVRLGTERGPRLVLAPEAQCDRRDDGVFEFLAGEVQLASSGDPIAVQSPHGVLRIEGSARLRLVEDRFGESWLELLVHEGRATLTEQERELRSVAAGKAVMIQDGRVVETLEPVGPSELLADVPATSPRTQEDQAKEVKRLRRRVRELEAEVERLRVLATVSGPQGDLAPGTVLENLAERLERHGDDAESVWRAAQVQARVFRALFPRRGDSVREFVTNALAGEPEPASAVLVVAILSRFGRSGLGPARQLGDHESPLVRFAVLEAMTRHAGRNERVVDFARTKFSEDPDPDVRLAAAGVLLKAGAGREVLPWLTRQFLAEGPGRRRARILDRVLGADLETAKPFLVRVLREPSVTPWTSRVIGQQLVRRGHPAARQLLQELSRRAMRPAIRRHLRQMLERSRRAAPERGR